MANDLLTIMQENLNLKQRQEILNKIETELSERYKKKVSAIAYIFNTSNAFVNMPMNLSHISHLEDLVRISKENGSETLALMVESLGGDANFPSELDDRIRKYYDEYFTIGVNVLKSAATLLSLLSDKVIALETASFGPVDPQLLYTSKDGVPVSIPARAIVDLFEKTLPTFIKSMGPPERTMIMASQNYILYQQAKDAIKNVGIVVERLKSKKRLNDTQLKEVKKKLIDEPLSHGNRIDIGELSKMGVKTESLSVSDSLAELLIEYHRRAIRNLMIEVHPGQQGVILFESTKRSLQLGAFIPPPQAPISTGTPSPVAKPPEPNRMQDDEKKGENTTEEKQ